MLKNFAMDPKPSRRRFLQGSAAAAAGLTIGFHWSAGPKVASAAAAGGGFVPNAFVRIGTDNTVTVLSKHLEMGQGVYTGLATLVAEELDADWSQVRVEGAPADASLYNNLAFGPVQGTGGSSSIANSYEQLRKAGATARALLVEAAAREWKVNRAGITVEKGVVSHASSGRSATFGELAAKATGLPVPADMPLKDPSSFTLIGTSVPRVDTRSKSNGTAQFALDVVLPGMVTAVIARPPVFGATVKSVDDAKALAIPGVVKVVRVPSGVAVVATNFWAAGKGREALAIEWDESGAEIRGTAELMAEYKALAGKPGAPARVEGDAAKALAGAAKTVTASFEFPYLAHAPMEPLDCVVRLDASGCEIWAGDQFQTIDQGNAAAAAGLKPEQVRINTLVAGGSFGRRANAASDYIVEAVHVAKALDRGTPVKLVWTREDDIRGGRYRPMYYHTLTAGLDASGKPVAWQHRIVGQSIIGGTPFAPVLIKDGVDGTSVEGASNLPYDIPNMLVDLHTTEVGVPVLWWRAVGSTHTAYSTEVFIDELASAAGKDPVEFRRALLARHPRHLGVLNLAAEKAGWGTPLPQGKARGVAVHESFSTYVAQVAEVTLQPDGSVKVDRVVCAVDCGLAINPDVIRAQMEGGIGFGLGGVMYGEVTLAKGRVEQSNFHDYRVLRIEEMPAVEVHIVPSAAAPTGVGEPGVPPIGPAVANAVFAATGRRIRNLPFTRDMNV
ncbi:xanthine dehydrogenase family protein molybdopterin-binding subunit [Skermanella mucosa]|uniref:xanthine dehydrogenase family protein molybdopterin-binding subunit n=1 Tax=Skermanella mucosa TaxID=1789672 RepID=UPI001E484AAB|nr:xanthine dehydrogenase family protein molybdopterin-binding subunit [Skermanella mucosa]UEM18881.1 xanthine dehydrogenase family protein molybdopterin-binding subunit [Skermanella mucosa]